MADNNKSIQQKETPDNPVEGTSNTEDVATNLIPDLAQILNDIRKDINNLKDNQNLKEKPSKSHTNPNPVHNGQDTNKNFKKRKRTPQDCLPIETSPTRLKRSKTSKTIPVRTETVPVRSSYVNHEQISDEDEEEHAYSQGYEEFNTHANQTDGYSSQDCYADQGIQNELDLLKNLSVPTEEEKIDPIDKDFANLINKN